jgi:N-acetylmuramoyl-L-alanine amidase
MRKEGYTMKIFINPGHGQKSNGVYDPGAVGATGLHEAKVTLAIGNLLSTKLQSTGITTMVYQHGDLSAVCNQENAWGGDYFISIHCNAHADRAANGLETWYYQGSAKGQALSRSIQTQLVKTVGRADRGVKSTTSLYALKNTRAPAALAEIGFISNLAEEALMKTAKWQEDAAEALAAGICAYAGIPYKSGASQEPSAPTGLVQNGATGGVVVWVQQRLNVWGYNLDPDGDFGPLTETAVKAFQKDKGLDPDGIVGPLTTAALKTDPPKAEQPEQPDDHEGSDKGEAIGEAIDCFASDLINVIDGFAADSINVIYGFVAKIKNLLKEETHASND